MKINNNLIYIYIYIYPNRLIDVSPQMSVYWQKREFSVNIQCADIAVGGPSNLGNLVPFHQQRFPIHACCTSEVQLGSEGDITKAWVGNSFRHVWGLPPDGRSPKFFPC